MAKGKFAALQQLKPLQGDITTDVLNRQDQNFKKRAEQRQIKAQTKREADAEAKKQQEKSDKLTESLKEANIGDTGFKSHDEPLVKILQGENGVFDQISKLHDDLNKNPNDEKLIIKKINLEKSIETLKGLRDGIIQRGEANRQGIADGTLSKSLNKGFAANYDQLIDKYQYSYKITDDGQIIVQNKGNIDLDGDGMPDEITIQDIFDPEKLGGNKKLFNPGAWLKSKKPFYGNIDETKPKNEFGTIQYKGFNINNLDALNKDIDNLFGEDLLDMTDEAKSFINDTLNSDFNDITEKKFDKLKSEFAKQFIATYDTTEKETFNAGQKTARINAGLAAERERRLSTEKDNKISSNTLRNTVDGMLAGDKQSILALNNLRIGTVGEKFIEDAEFSNQTIVFKIVNRKSNTSEIIQIDVKDKEAAIPEILSYIRRGEDVDKVLAEYNNANPDKTFEQNINTKPTKIKLETIIEGIPKKSHKAVPYLLENGFQGFEDIGGRFGNNIKAPNGKTYNVNSTKEMTELKKYLNSEDFQNITISESPKDFG